MFNVSSCQSLKNEIIIINMTAYLLLLNYFLQCCLNINLHIIAIPIVYRSTQPPCDYVEMVEKPTSQQKRAYLTSSLDVEGAGVPQNAAVMLRLPPHTQPAHPPTVASSQSFNEPRSIGALSLKGVEAQIAQILKMEGRHSLNCVRKWP